MTGIYYKDPTDRKGGRYEETGKVHSKSTAQKSRISRNMQARTVPFTLAQGRRMELSPGSGEISKKGEVMDEERTNLQKLLAAKNISTKTVQSVIRAKSEKTAYNKIIRLTDFTLPEAIALKNAFFPEYDLDYIFSGYSELKAM